MKTRVFALLSLASLTAVIFCARAAAAKSYIAYISDSSNSSVVYWIAKEAGIFKKHGLDLDTIFIDGSVRGIQSLIAGDLGYSGAVGTAVINAKLAGARDRDHSEPDEYAAVLRRRQREHQVAGRLARQDRCGAYSRHLGGLRAPAGFDESRHRLQRH